MRRSRRFLLPLALVGALVAHGCGHPGVSSVLTAAPLDESIAGMGSMTWPGVTSEETRLLSRGLLPSSYPILFATSIHQGVDAARAMLQKGKPGPFSDDVGDPAQMLNAARYAVAHPEYERWLRTIKRGDLLLVTRNNPKDFIAQMTGGPYSHALICADPTPPALFIEAVGMTGEAGDPTTDRVRVTTAAKYASDDISMRLLKPAELLPPSQQAAAREAAIVWAIAQLGKPYNYSFSDKAGGDHAFYCSSFVYRAYLAGGVKWPLKKDPARDRMLLAVKHLVHALEPDDDLVISTKLMVFMHQLPKPTGEQMADFVVQQLLPHTRRTALLAATPAQQAGLTAALAKVFRGEAFPLFQASASDYKEAAADNRFLKPVSGKALKFALEARMAEDVARDAAVLVATSDINAWHSLGALRVLLGAVLPYADDFAAYLSGPTSVATRGTNNLMDMLDKVHVLAPHWPAHGFGLADLPARAPFTADLDFVSPSDLAYSGMPHEDFNSRSGESLDAPWPHAVVPPDGHYGKLLGN